MPGSLLGLDSDLSPKEIHSIVNYDRERRLLCRKLEYSTTWHSTFQSPHNLSVLGATPFNSTGQLYSHIIRGLDIRQQ